MSAGLVVLGVLLWQVALPRGGWVGDRRGDSDRGRSGLTLDTAVFRVLPIETVEYLAECGRNPALPDGPAGQDEFVRRCLHRLARALEAQSDRDTVRQQVIRLHLEAVHQAVATVARTAGSVVPRAGVVREAMLAQSYLLVQLHRARYQHVPQLSGEVAQARRTARAIDPDDPLQQQSELVEGFFRRAGNSLYLMEAANAEEESPPDDAEAE